MEKHAVYAYIKSLIILG